MVSYMRRSALNPSGCASMLLMALSALRICSLSSACTRSQGGFKRWAAPGLHVSEQDLGSLAHRVGGHLQRLLEHLRVVEQLRKLRVVLHQLRRAQPKRSGRCTC